MHTKQSQAAHEVPGGLAASGGTVNCLHNRRTPMIGKFMKCWHMRCVKGNAIASIHDDGRR